MYKKETNFLGILTKLIRQKYKNSTKETFLKTIVRVSFILPFLSLELNP